MIIRIVFPPGIIMISITIILIMLMTATISSSASAIQHPNFTLKLVERVPLGAHNPLLANCQLATNDDHQNIVICSIVTENGGMLRLYSVSPLVLLAESEHDSDWGYSGLTVSFSRKQAYVVGRQSVIENGGGRQSIGRIFRFDIFVDRSSSSYSARIVKRFDYISLVDGDRLRYIGPDCRTLLVLDRWLFVPVTVSKGGLYLIDLDKFRFVDPSQPAFYFFSDKVDEASFWYYYPNRLAMINHLPEENLFQLVVQIGSSSSNAVLARVNVSIVSSTDGQTGQQNTSSPGRAPTILSNTSTKIVIHQNTSIYPHFTGLREAPFDESWDGGDLLTCRNQTAKPIFYAVVGTGLPVSLLVKLQALVSFGNITRLGHMTINAHGVTFYSQTYLDDPSLWLGTGSGKILILNLSQTDAFVRGDKLPPPNTLPSSTQGVQFFEFPVPNPFTSGLITRNRFLFVDSVNPHVYYVCNYYRPLHNTHTSQEERENEEKYCRQKSDSMPNSSTTSSPNNNNNGAANSDDENERTKRIAETVSFVVAGVIFVFCVGAVFYICLRRQRERERKEDEELRMTAMSLINESMYPTNAATLSETSTRTPSVLSDEVHRHRDQSLPSSTSSAQISSANSGILISQRYATAASASSTNNSFVNPLLNNSSVTSANNNRSIGLTSERGKNGSSASTGRRVRFVGFDDDDDAQEQGVKSEEV